MENSIFSPFYERLAKRFPGYIIGEVFVSVFPGASFSAAYYGCTGKTLSEDFAWFLAILITTAMLCLYYATYTLRRVFPEMDMHLHPADAHVYMVPLKKTLSDRNFVIAGLFFGSLNCALGYCFGLPVIDSAGTVIILCGYLLAGFICGMAAFGIYGVSVAVIAFSGKAKNSFDFTSPDHCGGMQFLGDALVVFSSVTLIVGVLISVYILKTDWTGEETWWISTLKGIWIVFPYLMSLTALIVPAVATNKALTEYKMDQEILLQKQLTTIRTRLESDQLNAAEKEELRKEYAFQQNLRKDLHGMRTWPFGVSANLRYLAVFLPNVYASAKIASVWIRKLF